MSGYRQPPRRENQPQGHGNPPQKTLDQLWPDYLKAGYFDPDGNLRVDFVSRSKVQPLVQEMGNAKLTSNQLRRFFQHCRAIEARLRAKTSSWRAEEAAFRMLDVAAADALGKSTAKIPKLFHDFVQRNVAAVRTETDFLKGFLPHFEALVGFGSQFIRDKERN
jgi:CRISPR type III-A-associated protein Csm2